MKLCLQIIKLLTGRRGRSGDASVGGAGLGSQWQPPLGGDAVPAPARRSPALRPRGARARRWAARGARGGDNADPEPAQRAKFPEVGSEPLAEEFKQCPELSADGRDLRVWGKSTKAGGGGWLGRPGRLEGGEAERPGPLAAGPGREGRDRGSARLSLASGCSAAGPCEAPTVNTVGTQPFEGYWSGHP